MKIFIDPTEARRGSRLPAEVIKASTVLIGLEALTGADLILSPLDKPEIATLGPCPANVLKLKVHLKAGILVQRKSGGDFVGSIGKLPEIEYRMLQWGTPWLIVTGEMKCNAKGRLVMDRRTYGVSYWAAIGALDTWQLRGGWVTILSGDSLVAKWLSDQAARLSTCGAGRVVAPQKPRQELLKEDELGQVMSTLMTFPHIGAVTALSIARQCKTLREAFRMLSDPGILKSKSRPEGVGPVLVREFRRVMSLREGESIE